MKILVADREPPAREWVRRLLAEVDGDHELAAEVADGWAALDCCRAQPIDLVLLDFQVIESLDHELILELSRLSHPPAVILMSQDEITHSARRLDTVVDCVPKPVRLERLEEALQRATNLSHGPRVGTHLEPQIAHFPRRRRQISANYRGKLRSVALRDVIYLRADHKYVTVRHLGGELLVDQSLRSFERDFPELFMRVHRNALVATARLLALEKAEDGSICARLQDCEERLAVSRRHVTEVRERLTQGA